MLWQSTGSAERLDVANHKARRGELESGQTSTCGQVVEAQSDVSHLQEDLRHIVVAGDDTVRGTVCIVMVLAARVSAFGIDAH